MDRRALLGLAAIAVAATPAKAGPAASATATDAYLSLPTLTATITRPGGQRGVLSIEVGLSINDAALHARTTSSLPRLRAALSGVAQQTGARLLPGQPPDIDRLSREFQATVDQTLGRAGARVLLGTVMIS
jgi:flagellar basal body-associated protein FliL